MLPGADTGFFLLGSWAVRVKDVEWPAQVDGGYDSDYARVKFRIGARFEIRPPRVTRLVYVRDYGQEAAIQVARSYIDRTLRPIAYQLGTWHITRKQTDALIPEVLDPSAYDDWHVIPRAPDPDDG